MPDKSGPQERFMQMSLHNPEKMKNPAPKSVAQEFINADKAAGKKFPAKRTPKVGMVKPR